MGRAEIISIGDEILIGQTINTNAGWLGEQLSLIGISVQEVVVITDNKDHILRAVTQSLARVDLVIITGGLGPTKDDITKETLAEFFDSELVMDEDVLARIERYFEKKGRTILDSNVKQAALPEKAKIIRNDFGTASGMWFERDDKVVLSMPGVPYEMKDMMEREVLDMIQERFGSTDIVHRTVLTQGIGESTLANKIETWEDEIRDRGLKLAYLPSPGIVRLRVSAIDLKDGEKQATRAIEELKQIIPEHIFGFEKDSIEEIIGALLKQKKATMSTAESCTGGLISHMITSVSGSSEYFEGAVVSYSNDLKMNFLQVDAEDLKNNGAVSRSVVEQMAKGGCKVMDTDYCVATSGIAGPTGGVPGKPIGMVWIAVAGPNGVTSEMFNFGDNRERNIKRSALSALNMLRDVLIEEK